LVSAIAVLHGNDYPDNLTFSDGIASDERSSGALASRRAAPPRIAVTLGHGHVGGNHVADVDRRRQPLRAVLAEHHNRDRGLAANSQIAPVCR